MSNLSIAEWDRARRDPVVFADVVLGEPLWPHQVEVVRSPARYRVLCSGRRSGKTRVFGILALHRMFAVPGSRVLMVSAGETSVKRTHREIAGMAMASRLTAGAVADDNVLTLTLSNGSQLESVTQSERSVRSADADLLIVDEAGFVEQGVWESAEPVIGARPGARVLISSTPWRGPGHFFHDLWRQGMDRPDAEVAAWHWPTSISPLVDEVWLEGVRERSATDYFEREYLAKWQSQSGAYFTDAELMSAVAGYKLLDPSEVREQLTAGGRVLPAVAGVDWGQARDANALVLVAPMEDHDANADRLGAGGRPYYVPWLRAEHQWPWDDFIDYVVAACSAYDVHSVASEVNGVGAWPTDDLEARLAARVQGGRWGRVLVSKVWTDVRRKQSGFAKIKGLLQRGHLVLPNHPELLKQLRALEFEQTAAGSMRIAVPERAGHDDLALALMQAVSCTYGPLPRVATTSRWPDSRSLREQARAWERARAATELVKAGSGLLTPVEPRPCRDVGTWSTWAEGDERSAGW